MIRTSQRPPFFLGPVFLLFGACTQCPSAMQSTQLPIATRGTQFPIATRGTQFPIATRGIQFLIAMRDAQYPNAKRGTQFPLAMRGTEFPMAARPEMRSLRLSIQFPGFAKHLSFTGRFQFKRFLPFRNGRTRKELQFENSPVRKTSWFKMVISL